MKFCQGMMLLIANTKANLEPGASLEAQLVKTLPAVRRPRFNSWVRKICWRRDRLPSPVFMDFPGSSAGKESTSNSEDLGSIPGLGRSSGEGKGYALQHSSLENSLDCIVHGASKSWTWLTFTFTFILVPYCFDYCSYVRSFEIGMCGSSNFAGVFVCFLIWFWLLWASWHYVWIWRWTFPFLQKRPLKFWQGSHWICKHFGDIAILTILKSSSPRIRDVFSFTGLL